MGSISATTDRLEPPRALLDEAYRSLDYLKGTLLTATNAPLPSSREAEEWLDKGDWLALAHTVGAEKIFFVNNDPVIVFYALQQIPHEDILLDIFRRIWCMARPQCLFLALPGELRVYRLNQAPAVTITELQKRQLAIAHDISQVAEKLHAYRRTQVESGLLFAEKFFGDFEERADRQLIQDLKTIRLYLLRTGLQQNFAHALIGRSIFIRYLEDRNVLKMEHYEEIARGHPEWANCLQEELEKPDLRPGQEKRIYVRVLRNKDFTYALFDWLAEHFNGDMFPKDAEEKQAIDEKKHLHGLRSFLLGYSDINQPTLFFWAYDFEIIPIELISSIYEEFYHKENIYDKRKEVKQDDKGTYYTPSVLVEFILSQVLTEERLATNPRIVDPACGSGIFLVEAFRRIVRYHYKLQAGKALQAENLRHILREQLRGIEINEEATRVAAFSLYLALLHYQQPPDILNWRLPNLLFKAGQLEDDNHFNTLFCSNTFSLVEEERQYVGKALETTRYKGRKEDEKLYHSPGDLPIALHSCDIIAGNPPWGFEKGTTKEIQQAKKQQEQWCQHFGWSIGDKEQSQAFIARALSLLKTGGECGLLASTGIFFNHRDNSKAFRQRWLSEATIKTVVNFAHVRHAFFHKKANAPFAFIHFQAVAPPADHWISYLSVKKTVATDKAQLFVLGQPDIRRVRQADLIYHDFLWKVYWWGNHHDAAFIKALRINPTISELGQKKHWSEPGRGFQATSFTYRNKPSAWLRDYKVLPTEDFQRYGPVDISLLQEPPEEVTRLPSSDRIQIGWRLLIGQGITQANGVNGRIEARLENRTYCFDSSIFGINLDEAEEWERKIIIGIAWSSLARYYYFMIAGTWGGWRHKIRLEDAMSLPIRFPKEDRLRHNIIDIVDILLQWPVQDYLESGLQQAVKPLEQQLDEAIFELYQLNEAQRDLVLDTCETTLEFFYQHSKSEAIQSLARYPRLTQGIIDDLPKSRARERGLEGYLFAFLSIWNHQLEPDGEFYWRVIRPAQIPMIAVVFTTQEVGDALPTITTSDEQEWQQVLEQCANALHYPISRRIYIDGMVRVVTDTEIYVIKRDERRLWTRSMAREDAEATLVQLMYLQEHMLEETV